MTASIYKSPAGEARILELYDRFEKCLNIDFGDRMVNTRFGATHVLVTGPEQGLPVVIKFYQPAGDAGSPTPAAARALSIFAPDTIGDPGKSAQIRLSPRDQSYGLWLNDVLDGLGLDSAAFIGGSFGAGIMLSPSHRRLQQAVQWMGSGSSDGILELVEAVFKHVRVEAEMPRPATKVELSGFTSPTMVISAFF
ncbi:MAG TPA: hypothetical protein VD969_23800 [Symbiobacteriaceae bacterium]|nr:hypothetical protein [Symbiobacteriaceae bacterium]